VGLVKVEVVVREMVVKVERAKKVAVKGSRQWITSPWTTSL
jgi:hypothetical protein